MTRTPFASPFQQADLVIFDVDGTLIDSVDAHTDAWVRAFGKFGVHVPYAALRAQIGKGTDQLLPEFLSAIALKTTGRAISDAHDEIFAREHKPLLRAFPGVRGLMELIKAQGKLVAIASSGTGANVEFCQQLARITGMIDVVATSDDAVHSKPRSDIFRIALEKAGYVDPARAVMVGDSPWDAIGARTAGMRSIGLRCGGFGVGLLLAAGCEALYGDVAELLANERGALHAAP